jgi:ATP-binding cassette subfamily B protein
MLTFVVALGLMIAIDPRLTLYALIPLPFVSLSVKFFGSAIHKRFEQIQAQLADVSAIAQEALAGVRVVRAYRQEQAELDRFRQSNIEYLDRNRRLIALQGFFFPSMSFFLGLGTLLVIWLGTREVIRGRITVGEFVAFQRLPDDAQLADDCLRVGNEHAAARHGVVEAHAGSSGHSASRLRIWEWGLADSFQIRGRIEFHDLTFGYGDRPILRASARPSRPGRPSRWLGQRARENRR